LSEQNQTEDGNLEDPKKDVANSIVLQFTETDGNVLTVTNGDDEMVKPNLYPVIKERETPVSLPRPQGQASSIRLISNL
jgi:hypothetical protein